LRPVTALLILGCIVSLSPGQYVETTIFLPDSTSGLTSVGSLVYHSPTHTIYVGGNDSFLVAVNAQTNSKLRKVAVGGGPHVLCSDPPGNKVYCANNNATVTVIDGATNQSVKTFSVGRNLTDLCYNGQEDKLYCGNANDSFVRVIDCAGDSVVARVPVSLGPGALCYNPQLNRIYCACSARDEVSVIDCSADTVVGTVWARGVEPQDICYDSATNCVYTANSYSNTVSRIDCASDTLVRLVPVGRVPVAIMAGPPGKVYCANYHDSSVSVISGNGVDTVRTCEYPRSLSYDPVNNKVYCASDSRALVTVIDAATDTVLADVGTGSDPTPAALFYNPAGNNTYVACTNVEVSAIGGVSDTVEATIPFGACTPGPLCYNATNNRLYCLDQGNDLLFVIDGDSSRVLRTINTGGNPGNLAWSPASNKVYFTNGGTVSILDCSVDSIVATVEIDASPFAACCSDAGKVYFASLDHGSVTVVDGNGDSVRAVISVGGQPWTLCCDQTDDKVYVGKFSASSVDVIDSRCDSLVATIPLPPLNDAVMCWNTSHDVLFVGGAGYDSLVLIDCTSDKIIRRTPVYSELSGVYSDTVSDKIYGVDYWNGYLRIVQAATGEFHKHLYVGSVTALLDNGKPGPANQLYCALHDAAGVKVVGTYKIDTVLCSIPVGAQPSALAWNPTHSWVYVSNSGSSSITVIRDTFGVGVEESQPKASSHKQQVTVVRGVLVLGVDSRQNTGHRAELLDAAGRRVMILHPGANDVRGLAPGVYFVRLASGVKREASRVTKVVVTR
jgi:YVTN family beta-propeller protein